MLFTTTEDTWTNGDGDLVKKIRMTFIRYQGFAARTRRA
jgi:hypothetical protein